MLYTFAIELSLWKGLERVQVDGMELHLEPDSSINGYSTAASV
jgi:hypothetical protein